MNFKQTMSILLPTTFLLFSAPSQAGSFEVLTASRCAEVPRKMLFSIINEIGIEKGLNLPADRRIHAELVCTPAGENYLYTYRITLEKTRKEKNSEWIQVLDMNTDAGVVRADLIVAAIKFSTQKLVP